MTPGRPPVPSSPFGGPESHPAPGGPTYAHEGAAISAPMGAPPEMDEGDGPTIRFDPRKVADFVRREAASAPQGMPVAPAFAGQAPPAFAGHPASPLSGSNQLASTTPYPAPAGGQAPQPAAWQQGGERSTTEPLMPRGGQGMADGPSDPAEQWGPAMTPHGTIRMSTADVVRIDAMVRAKQMTADSSTAPLVQSTSPAPPPNVAGLAPLAPAMAAPNRQLKKMLIVAGTTAGAGFLVLAILYFALVRGSGGATATAASTHREATPPASVGPSSTPGDVAPSTPAPIPPTPSEPVPGGPASGTPTASAAPTAPLPSTTTPPVKTTTTAASPAKTGTGSSAGAPPKKDCSKLRFLEKELCLKGQAAR